MDSNIKEMQEHFKETLFYGYQRGIENRSITAKELVQELTDKMREFMTEGEYTRN
ncbi:hypothetical protein ACWV26_02480 [Rummeliibacillus sp. JY-2-4R]